MAECITPTFMITKQEPEPPLTSTDFHDITFLDRQALGFSSA
jgi:hypothetical protein